MHDLYAAKRILTAQDLTCVLYHNGEQRCSTQRGVAPLLQWLDDEHSYQGFSAADRVVGNGAAYLYVLLGVKAVYGAVISESALQTLRQYGIAVLYDTLTPAIQNRTKTGLCPIEQAIAGVSSPDDALTAIRTRLQSLRGQSDKMPHI